MSATRTGSTLALLAMLAMATACGGGSGDGDPAPTPEPTVTPLFSTASLDGWVDSDDNFDADGSSSLPWSGDIDQSVPDRSGNAYYSFPLTVIPAGAVFVDATFEVSVRTKSGDPAAQYGGLQAWFAPYGNSLAGVVGMMLVNPPPYAPFSPPTDSPGVKVANVTNILRRAVSDGYDRLQIGVGYAAPSNNDGIGQWVNLSDAENLGSSQPPPRLTVSWYVP